MIAPWLKKVKVNHQASLLQELNFLFLFFLENKEARAILLPCKAPWRSKCYCLQIRIFVPKGMSGMGSKS